MAERDSMENFVVKIKKTLAENRMILPGDKIVMAVSGGSDSVAMAHALYELRDELGLKIFIGHLNHSARGKESDDDARFVEGVGKSLGIETFVLKVDIEIERKKLKTSFQEAARIIRHQFLESLLSDIGGNKIALGHHIDDQVETVLVNLLRGSGLKGLGGMAPVRGPYIRPLSECYRHEVVAYLKARQLKFREDVSNTKKDYLRNRLRLDLIPLLEKDYNVNLKQSIYDMAGIIRAEDQYISGLVEGYFEQIFRTMDSDAEGVEVKIAELKMYPLPVQRRLIRQAIQKVKGSLRKISASHVQDVLDHFCASHSDKKIPLPDDMQAWFINGTLKFHRIRDKGSCIQNKESGCEVELDLKIPGETDIKPLPLRLITSLVTLPDKQSFSTDSNEAWLDFDKTGENIRIRFFQKGDRFNPLGMVGAKKLKSFFIDNKIPFYQRSRIPILTTPEDEIIWVYGQRISHKYRITQETMKVLHIEGIAG